MRIIFFMLMSLLFAVDTAPLITAYQGVTPNYWGERAPGVISRIETKDKVIFLTLDACGGTTDGYDKRLIDFLVMNKIPATLFINARWIDKFPSEFHELAANPLFEIENHGLSHRPCSINGRSAYGIKGTQSVRAVIEEVEGNATKIANLTGRRPRFYRSGTAFYDEIAVKVVNQLGYQAAGFSVLGDAGATYSSPQVEKAVLTARSGDIVLCHMNHPESGTHAGLQTALTQLIAQGYRFVRLSESSPP